MMIAGIHFLCRQLNNDLTLLSAAKMKKNERMRTEKRNEKRSCISKGPFYIDIGRTIMYNMVYSQLSMEVCYEPQTIFFCN